MAKRAFVGILIILIISLAQAEIWECELFNMARCATITHIEPNNYFGNYSTQINQTASAIGTATVYGTTTTF